MDEKVAGLLNRKCKRTMLGAGSISIWYVTVGVKVLISDPKCISILYVISHHPDSLSGNFLRFWSYDELHQDTSQTIQFSILGIIKQCKCICVCIHVSLHPKLGPTKMSPALCVCRLRETLRRRIHHWNAGTVLSVFQNRAFRGFKIKVNKINTLED